MPNLFFEKCFIPSVKVHFEERIFILDCSHSTNSARNSELGMNLTFGPDESTSAWQCCFVGATCLVSAIGESTESKKTTFHHQFIDEKSYEEYGKVN
jgi:hypothetical protein